MGAEQEAQVRVGEPIYSKIQLGRSNIRFPISSHLFPSLGEIQGAPRDSSLMEPKVCLGVKLAWIL